MADYNTIKQQIRTIKNATEEGTNTAMRVGDAMEGTLDYTKEQNELVQEIALGQISVETQARTTAINDVILRLRGDENYHDNYQDPLLTKIFSTPDPQTDPFSGRRDLAAYLDTLHSSDANNLKPVGLLRLNIDGSALWAISNVRSFAADIWTQVLLNAYVDSNGIGTGTAMYVRESKPVSERTSASDVWNAWERCSLSTSDTVSLITAVLQGNYATLVDGKVPSSQLPAYVDEIEEYASRSVFPASGTGAKIYLALDTNKQYRWSGTQYAEVSASLALGETSSTAFAGNRGVALETAQTGLATRMQTAEDTATALGGSITSEVTNRQSADAEVILRMQGRSNNQDLNYDPFYYKVFLNEDAQENVEEANEWLDGLHGTNGDNIPKGFLRVDINGAVMFVINMALHYAADVWEQTVLNGSFFGDYMHVGESMYRRVHVDGNWQGWEKMADISDVNALIATAISGKADTSALTALANTLASDYYTQAQVNTALANKANVSALTSEVTRATTAEQTLNTAITALTTAVASKVGNAEITNYMAEGTVMPWIGVFTYEGMPVSHYRVIQNGATSFDLVFCVSHIDATEQQSALYVIFTSGDTGWVYVDSYTYAEAVADHAWIVKAFGEYSAPAVEGGTELSMVTTGEKYQWNNAAQSNGVPLGDVLPAYNLCHFGKTANLRASNVQTLDGLYIDENATSSTKENYLYIDKMSSNLIIYTDRYYDVSFNGGFLVKKGEQLIRSANAPTNSMTAKLHIPYTGMVILWMGVASDNGYQSNQEVSITDANDDEVVTYKALTLGQLMSPIVLYLTAGDYYINYTKVDFFFHSASLLMLKMPLAVCTGDASHRTVTDAEKTSWNNKQAQTTVNNLSSASITAADNMYYRLTNTVTSLAITLPTISDTSTVHCIAFKFATGSSTPTISWSNNDSKAMYKQDGYSIATNSVYEVTALYNGYEWIINAVKLVSL